MKQMSHISRKYLRLPIAILALTSGTLWLASCSGDREQSAEGSAATPADPLVRGKKIYNRYCIACHGSDGSMGANGAFNLKTTGLSLEEKIHIITNGRNTMTPFAKVLSADEIAAVAAYTEQFKQPGAK